MDLEDYIKNAFGTDPNAEIHKITKPVYYYNMAQKKDIYVDEDLEHYVEQAGILYKKDGIYLEYMGKIVDKKAN